MDFRSDNTAQVHPKVLDSFVKVNNRNSSSYGADSISHKLQKKFTDLFGQEISLALVSTGTAANCISLRSLCPGYGCVLMASESHLHNDEGQAPELLLSGAKLRTFSTAQRKIDLAAAQLWVNKATKMKPHGGKASCVSITQATEWGDVYSLQELRDIRQFCDDNKLNLHVDGARLSNALVAQNLNAAEFIKIARPDIMSFGLTKNGGLMAEAVILFNSHYRDDLIFAQKQTGQLLSKNRFIASQFLALLENDLWLEMARHANQKSCELTKVLEANSSIKLVSPTKTNQIFVAMPQEIQEKLQTNNVLFYHWQDDIYRFVTSWTTSSGQIQELNSILN